MTFVATLALLIGLIALGPLVAHLLRRGRADEIPFAPTQWVPSGEHLATQRKSVDQRLLLAIRASLIFALALLGATPLLKCDRKTLDRAGGASVARILLLDDSGSMGAALEPGKTRFLIARRAALSLVEQMQQGDSIGIVLGSKPARVLLAPSSNLKTVTAALLTLTGTDRPTDLAEALSLSHSVIARQPHSDKKILLFSDLAQAALTPSPDVQVMLPELSRPISDCALLTANRRGHELVIEFVCTTPLPNQSRELEVVATLSEKRTLFRKPFAPASRGELVLRDELSKGSLEQAKFVRLQAGDDNPANDVTPIITEDFRLVVGFYSDPADGQVTTGGPPILEQALRAVEPDIELRSFSTVPEDAKTLAAISLLILDDPPLLSAEARSAISDFTSRGNTAVALFGPSASGAQLGSLLAPFLTQSATWRADAPQGLDLGSIKLPLPGASSLQSLGAKGRLAFDESHDPSALVQARWSDQVPFWLTRPLGRGTLQVLGLPSQVALSDWALRPGFLSVLEHLLVQHQQRGHNRVVVAGDRWLFQGDAPVSVEGPKGRVPSSGEESGQSPGHTLVRPERVGRYQVSRGAEVEERIATWPEAETTVPSQPWPEAAGAKTNPTTGQLDITRYIAIGLLGLLLAEMLLRFATLKGGLKLPRALMSARAKSGHSRQSG